MKWLQLIGRVLFGMLFVSSGIMGHFMNLESMGGYAASKGVPMPEVMVIVTGAMITLGGISVILGYKPKIGLWLLVAFLVPTAFIMHNFWALAGEQAMTAQSQFFKDMALAGAAMMMIVFATDERWPMSLGGWTSDLDNALPGPEAGPSGGEVQGGGSATSPMGS